MDHFDIRKTIRDAEAISLAYRIEFAGPLDWPEDFAHENGDYMCSCLYCARTFTGHKRRVVCKACDRALNELL